MYARRLRRLDTQQLNADTGQLKAGDLTLDPTYHSVTLNGAAVDLTATEFDLLSHLMRHPDRPFTRSQLLDITQPDALGNNAAYERTIDAHIKNIRHKLGDSGRHSRFIETVHGIGYRFLPQEQKP